MLVRKLRIEKGWSQETLAEVSGLSVRTVQRIERGGTASLETLSALAAVFEIEIGELTTETKMYTQNDLASDERDAIEYVRDIKGFYSHLAIYVLFIPVFIGFNYYTGFDNLWFFWPVLGWGLGVASHGLSVFEIVSLFSVDWERRQIEKRMRRNRD